jgi:hypothetical protein
LGQAHKCGGVKLVNGISTSSLLITGSQHTPVIKRERVEIQLSREKGLRSSYQERERFEIQLSREREG